MLRLKDPESPIRQVTRHYAVLTQLALDEDGPLWGDQEEPEVGEGEELKTSDQFHQTQVNFGLFCDYDVLTPTETINTTPYSRVWIISPSWNLENLPNLLPTSGLR